MYEIINHNMLNTGYGNITFTTPYPLMHKMKAWFLASLMSHGFFSPMRDVTFPTQFYSLIMPTGWAMPSVNAQWWQ
jgi:hypothetical protein